MSNWLSKLYVTFSSGFETVLSISAFTALQNVEKIGRENNLEYSCRWFLHASLAAVSHIPTHHYHAGFLCTHAHTSSKHICLSGRTFVYTEWHHNQIKSFLAWEPLMETKIGIAWSAGVWHFLEEKKYLNSIAFWRITFYQSKSLPCI